MARPYDLPSLTALLCFEAAARHLSFKQAAQELNVTPAAISHQVRGLEQDLDLALFRRQHRGVDLTESGAFLFVALQRGFDAMSEAIAALRPMPERDEVVVQTTTAVSAFWLTPKLAEFWRAEPSITVSQIVADVLGNPGRADLTVHYGPPLPNDPTSHALFRDEIIAVGAPGFVAQHGIAGVADLPQVPLIHVAPDGADWTTWADWLGHFGQPAPSGRRIAVNNHMIGLQLARDGVGAVLAWTGLAGRLLEDGALVPLVPDRMPSPEPFYLRCHPRASSQARRLRDWLIRQ